ncbi:MAG TPA: phospholipase D-like domain-containing protein [Vicinamibacteria bacterium]
MALAARVLADQAFSRAAGAPLVHGNAVRLLRDARENYPAWLEAIGTAAASVHFEMYMAHADEVGDRFVEALVAKARQGVAVRVVFDWLGSLGAGRGRLWRRLREGGVEARTFNPPRLLEPLGWIARNHRKSLVVDGRVAFVTGLCIGKMWEGWPERGLPGWRDTGVEIRGPAVADVARAFSETWALCGSPLAEEGEAPGTLPREGQVALRVVATTSGTSGLYRVDTLMAALARRTLWLTDAYYAGTPSYVQALRGAALDGVDVRLLVPGRGSDLRLMQAISRAGYRPLLDGGVRVFEWDGPMLHAKTAVADARWARVGSTNLNLASWIGNWELDVVVEDEPFGQAMEAMYLDDLGHATEIVLEQRRRVRPAGGGRVPRRRGAGGTAGRAAAGALRIGNAIGSALRARRLHGPAERRLMVPGGVALTVVAAVAFLWPRLVAWPLGALCLWLALSLLLRAFRR